MRRPFHYSQCMDQIPILQPQQIHDALQAFDVPGLAVAVMQRDEIAFAQGYGTRTLGTDEVVDKDTLFAVGSISKSFTATALAMLVDEGKLKWDDRVQQYLPWFAMHDPYVTREITVRDLLTHRVGLRSVSGGTVWYGSTYDRIEVLRRMRYLEPVSSFRAQFAYQNITYAAAGEIVAAITGRSWDQFVRERIFAPLGMTRSITAMDELEQRRNIATPHARVARTTAPVPHRNYDNVGPAASIYSSAHDMARYVRLHLAHGSFAKQQLIAPATAHEMHAPQMVIPIEPWPAALAALKPTWYTYGLGWFIRDYLGHKLVQHAGGVDGMVALATMLPEQQIGVVALANAEEALAAVTYTVLDTLLGVAPTDWQAAYGQLRRERAAERATQAEQIVAARVHDTQPSLPLDNYAGTYHDPLYGDVTVALEHDRLVLRWSHTPSFTAALEHWHHDTFRLGWHDPLVPPGLLTFADNKLLFDQPKLLDVDFGELHFVRSSRNSSS